MPSDPVDAPPAAACGRAARAWALRARLYDVLEASDRRRASAKRTLFQQMQGETLFVGIGTGLDIAHFPHGPAITAIDISPAMLARAQPRQRRYVAAIAPDGAGILRLEQQDAAALPYADACFDTVATACTLCSVPNAEVVLRELHRVPRPGGRLLLFEHVRSAHLLFAAVLDVMSLWSRRGGTDMSRDTVRSVVAAGFVVGRIEPVFLDIILAIEASRPVARVTPAVGS